jgi:hypothetical protein
MTSRSQYWMINNKMTVSDKEVETTTFLVLIVCEMSVSIGYYGYDIDSVLIDVVSIHIKALTTRRYLRVF